MTPPRLLNAIRDELISHGIVRRPSVAGAAPPMWLEPKALPAAGEGDDPVAVGAEQVLGLFLTGGVRQPPYSTLRQPIVDLRIRTGPNLAYLVEDLEPRIYSALGDKRDWMMSGVYVVESQQWRPMQRLGSGPQGYEHVTAFWFQLLR